MILHSSSSLPTPPKLHTITMKTHLLFLQLLFIPLTLGLINGPKCDLTTQDQDSNLRIFHIDSPCSPFKPSTPLSWEARVLQMLADDQSRFRYLTSHVAGKSVVPVASGRQILQTPTYIVKAKIGTPVAQTLLVAMDTSSDVAWFPCTGCAGCPSSTAFSPAKSTTFKNVSCKAAQCKQVPNPTCGLSACTFNLTYGTSSISANLSEDTLTLAQDHIPNYTFGCIQKVSMGRSIPPQGLLGLGRGPLSLLSQSQSLYKSTFSYCLPSFRSLNFSGSLRLGPTAQPIRLKYTPLLRSPRRSSLYYVNLVGIRVGRKVVNLPSGPLAFNPSTGSGTIIDSGTVFTRLVKPVYEAVRNEFRKRVRPRAIVSSLGGFDTCYSAAITAPAITFMFPGVNMTLAQENLLIHSTAGSTTCLAMAAAPDNVNSVVNVIANMQQQNYRILIDAPNSRLGLARERCS